MDIVNIKYTKGLIKVKKAYTPCKCCSNTINKAQEDIYEKVSEVQGHINLQNHHIEVGSHANFRAGERGISLKEVFFGLKYAPELVEIQKGTGYREFKLIYRVFSGTHNKPIHAILLVKRTGDPVLINTYFPTEGMSFKWDSQGRVREYFNELRNCCPHPDDSKKNYHKEHHGSRHKKYSYQK